MYGIDVNNIIKSVGPTITKQTYTATQDCWISFQSSSWGTYSINEKVNIDGVSIDAATGDNGFGWFTMLLPLKRGQTINLPTSSGNYNTWYKVFGIKK